MEETITQTARRYHLPRRPAWVGRTLGSPISPEISRALPLIAVVSAGAFFFLVAVVWSLAADPPKGSTTLGALALLGSAVIAEAFPVPIEGVSAGRTSLATVFIVGAAVIYDWRIAGVVGFLAMATVEIGRRRAPVRIAFNAGVYTLAAAAAGATAGALGEGSLLMLCIATLVVSTVFYVVNIGLLGLLFTRLRAQPVLQTLRGTLVSTTVPFAIMASLAVILVGVVGPLAVPRGRARRAARRRSRSTSVGSTERSTACASSTG